MKRPSRKQPPAPAAEPSCDVRAIVDIGSTSIRMSVAQMDSQNGVRNIEFLQQPVSIGKDTFTTGRIEAATTEACVRALNSFRQVMSEYGITTAEQIRAVATTAVREADNCDRFLDRLYMGTGIDVELTDPADVTRFTYLGIQSLIRSDPFLKARDILAVEVGGGNTDIIWLRRHNVTFSRTYTLGSLRMREMLPDFRAPVTPYLSMVNSEVERTVAQIAHDVPHRAKPVILALGGDVRFAAAALLPAHDAHACSLLPLKKLVRFTTDILKLSVDDLVRTQHLSFPDAETIGPALAAILALARVFEVEELVVTDRSMRDGLLTEMRPDRGETRTFDRQIVRSALQLAAKYDSDRDHVRHVARLAGELFEALKDEHRLGHRAELLMEVAAYVHDTGLFVGSRSHHKHSMYLVRNSELFGLNSRELLLVALVARYHRRATPRPTHEGYMELERDDRLLVSRLAAILRVADALDVAHSRRIVDMRCRREGDQFVIEVTSSARMDLSLEQHALDRKERMFEDVYGMQVVLRNSPAGRS